MSYEKERRYYILALVLLIVFSATFLIMPISNYVPYESSRPFLFITGIVFWGTGIVGYLLLLKVYKAEKQKERRQREGKQKLFSNVLTTIADTCFILGIIVFVVLVFTKQVNGYMAYLNIFIIVMSFNAHWLFSRDLHNKILKKVQ